MNRYISSEQTASWEHAHFVLDVIFLLPTDAQYDMVMFLNGVGQ